MFETSTCGSRQLAARCDAMMHVGQPYTLYIYTWNHGVTGQHLIRRWRRARTESCLRGRIGTAAAKEHVHADRPDGCHRHCPEKFHLHCRHH